jgi:hypothetical protein
MSTPEPPGADPNEPVPGTPQQPADRPADDPAAAPPTAPPVGPPATPSSGWGEVPRYGQPRYGQYGPQPTPIPSPAGMPPGGAWGARAARPGIVPLRPLTLGEIYDGAFGAIRHNPAVMLGVATLVILVATAVGVGVGQLLVPALTAQISGFFATVPPEVASGLGISPALYAQLLAPALGTTLTSLLASPVVNGILTVSVSRSVVGDKVTVAQVWQRVRSRVGLLVGWSLLQAVGVVVLSVLTVLLVGLVVAATAEVSEGLSALLALLVLAAYLVALVWLGVRLGLVAPAVALEGRGLVPTVRRAWLLTRGQLWRLFGVYLLAVVIVTVIANIVTTPLAYLATWMETELGAPGVGAVVVTTVATVVATAIQTIFVAGVVALLYVDVRMRREGLDVALAAAAADRPA